MPTLLNATKKGKNKAIKNWSTFSQTM